jgi:hypothetical protein
VQRFTPQFVDYCINQNADPSIATAARR